MRSTVRTTLLLLVTLIVIGLAAGCRPRDAGPDVAAVRIGAILPLTGPGSVFAQYIKEGLDLAAREINAGGGVPVEILYEDSMNQPKEGIAAFNKLTSISRPPVVVVALSSVARALEPLAQPADTAQVYIAVAIPDVTDGSYTFRVYPEAFGMAGVMAAYASDELAAKSAAVIHINDDFGRVSVEAFQQAFGARGGQVVFTESYQLVQTDFRSQIAKLKAVAPPPDIIYLNGYGPAYGAIIKQLRELAVGSQLTADMTLGLPNTLAQVGDSAEGAYFVDGKMSPEFVERFREVYDHDPSSYAGYAYDIVTLLYGSFQESGRFDRESIAGGLRGVSDHAGVMGAITIGENGDSNLEFVVKKIEGGQPVILDR